MMQLLIYEMRVTKCESISTEKSRALSLVETNVRIT